MLIWTRFFSDNFFKDPLDGRNVLCHISHFCQFCAICKLRMSSPLQTFLKMWTQHCFLGNPASYWPSTRLYISDHHPLSQTMQAFNALNCFLIQPIVHQLQYEDLRGNLGETSVKFVGWAWLNKAMIWYICRLFCEWTWLTKFPFLYILNMSFNWTMFLEDFS